MLLIKHTTDLLRVIVGKLCGYGTSELSTKQYLVSSSMTFVFLYPFRCVTNGRQFTLGLEHYYNSFDVVHLRSVANGVCRGSLTAVHTRVKKCRLESRSRIING